MLALLHGLPGMSKMEKPKFPSRYKPGDVVGKGSYSVVELLAQGGMAEVYRVTEVATGREFGFKVLQFRHQQNERIRSKMQQEARALIELRHRGLVRVYEAGVDDGGRVVYFVMELLEGRTLLDVLRFHGRLPLIEALEICEQGAEALAYLNRSGIVHRDIKPENIMVLPDGTVKIFDLGAARFERYGIVTTSPGDPIGTALYMSPEHLNGDPDQIDGRADVYSLGHVLYQCIAGHHGFFKDASQAATAGEVTSWQFVRDVRPLTLVDDSLPGVVWLLVQKALRKDREERYVSNHEFADRIGAVKLALEKAGYRQATQLEPEVADRAVVALDRKALHQKKLPFAMTEEARPPQPAPDTDVIPANALPVETATPHGTDIIQRVTPPKPVEPPKGPKGTFKMQAVDSILPFEPEAVWPPPPAPPPPAPPQPTAQQLPEVVASSPSPLSRASSFPSHAPPAPDRPSGKATPPAMTIAADPAIAARDRRREPGPDMRLAVALGAVLGIIAAIAFVATYKKPTEPQAITPGQTAAVSTSTSLPVPPPSQAQEPSAVAVPSDSPAESGPPRPSSSSPKPPPPPTSKPSAPASSQAKPAQAPTNPIPSAPPSTPDAAKWDAIDF